ncbi:MAG: hypothetical protein Q9163_004024 [Psora crenata]
MKSKPIPAFYCCYLLRSTVCNSKLYVGSTPDPKRRLGQHNGQSKGGAVYTARNYLQPWEMTCMVTGFPSRIAALQFEWAWRNTHVTKRIANDQRITVGKATDKPSRSGRARKCPAPPRPSLNDKLANLQLLLRAPSFARLPLAVRFFCEDVCHLWQQRNKQVRGHIGEGVEAMLDLKRHVGCEYGVGTPVDIKAKGKYKVGALGCNGVEGLDVGYSSLKDQIEKSIFHLADGKDLTCAVCSVSLGPELSTALVCPHEGCRATSHLSCLAGVFLVEEGQSESLVPVLGTCPVCKKRTIWIELIKQMSLRAKGEKEVALLIKKPKASRKTARIDSTTPTAIAADELNDASM